MNAEPLERQLVSDLATLGERLVDGEFCADLYRALAGNELLPAAGGQAGHVALSWQRAEDVVNALRERVGREPMALAQTGGEGEISRAVADALSKLGWRARPRDTSRHDDSHLSSPPGPPPPDQGERDAPVDPQDTRWEELAHAEADAEGRLQSGRPGESAATRGRDPEERARRS